MIFSLTSQNLVQAMTHCYSRAFLATKIKRFFAQLKQWKPDSIKAKRQITKRTKSTYPAIRKIASDGLKHQDFTLTSDIKKATNHFRLTAPM